MDRKRTLADSDLRALKDFMAVLDAFRAIRPTMPLQYVHTFFLVAIDEGLSVQEYAQRAGLSQSVMSRHLLDIGDRNRYMKEGFGLVTYRPNPLELCKHEVFLTDKGRALVHKIVRHLGR